MVRPPTAEEVAAFERDGVVLLKAFLEPASAQGLAAPIEALAAQIGQTSTGYDFEALGDTAYDGSEAIDYGHAKQYDLELFAGWLRHEDDPRIVDDVPDGAPKGAFLSDTGCWRRSEPIARLALDPSMGEAAGRLMRAAKVGFYDDQMFVKRPGTRQRTAFHQDYPFFHAEGWMGAVFWISADPVDVDNGPMSYVRGSHRWTEEFGAGMFVSRTVMPGSLGAQVPDIEGHPENYDLVSFEIEPGDVIVHHFRTIHGAAGNRSFDRQRRAMSLRYVGEDMVYRLKPGAPFQPHLTHRLEEGDPLWCDDFPLIWTAGERAA